VGQGAVGVSLRGLQLRPVTVQRARRQAIGALQLVQLTGQVTELLPVGVPRQAHPALDSRVTVQPAYGTQRAADVVGEVPELAGEFLHLVRITRYRIAVQIQHMPIRRPPHPWYPRCHGAWSPPSWHCPDNPRKKIAIHGQRPQPTAAHGFGGCGGRMCYAAWRDLLTNVEVRYG